MWPARAAGPVAVHLCEVCGDVRDRIREENGVLVAQSVIICWSCRAMPSHQTARLFLYSKEAVYTATLQRGEVRVRFSWLGVPVWEVRSFEDPLVALAHIVDLPDQRSAWQELVLRTKRFLYRLKAACS